MMRSGWLADVAADVESFRAAEWLLLWEGGHNDRPHGSCDGVHRGEELPEWDAFVEAFRKLNGSCSITLGGKITAKPSARGNLAVEGCEVQHQQADAATKCSLVEGTL